MLLQELVFSWKIKPLQRIMFPWGLELLHRITLPRRILG
jgi:hypothetical protein